MWLTEFKQAVQEGVHHAGYANLTTNQNVWYELFRPPSEEIAECLTVKKRHNDYNFCKLRW